MVVGAGPAGSIAAMTAAKMGVKTLILEKEPLPRYKLCGGAVPNWVVSYLNIPNEFSRESTMFYRIFPLQIINVKIIT